MKKHWTITTMNAHATAEAAAEFARTLRGGEVVGLIGNLGSGKTTFVQALAKELGVADRITSPTFVYMHVHKVRGQRSGVSGFDTFVHADAYKLDAEGLRGIGIEEFFGNPRTVVLIEWADKVEDLMPENAILIRFTHLGEDKRRIDIA